MAIKTDPSKLQSPFVSFIKSIFSFNHKASAESGVLRIGDRGPKVEELQRTLQVLEFYDYPDSLGLFGTDTRNAVMNFQRDNDLETSGVVDSVTLVALDKALDEMYPEIIFKRIMHIKSVGRDVKCLQRVLKSIGYFGQKPTGIFDENTYLSVCNFQKDYGLSVDGRVNARLASKINFIASSLRPLKLETETILQAYVPSPEVVEESAGEEIVYKTDAVKVQWHVVNKAWKINEIKTVTDLETGTSFNMKRTGGIHHIDAEPVTKNDAEALKKIFSGEWSWSRRPILMSVSYITTAASICGMPHGDYSVIGNGINGHFCLHFCESKDDQTKQVDPAHQKAIDIAAQYKI